MIGDKFSRARRPDPGNLAERYKGFVSLPKMLFPEDGARNIEAELHANDDLGL